MKIRTRLSSALPQENRTGEYEKIEGEDILFIYGQKENIFKENKLMFPLLSHA
jgi:hypothetical protein